MEDNENDLEFNSLEEYKYQIDIWYKVYNINREKTELFHDFLLSLYELIDSTYLGYGLSLKEEEKRNHFLWCWNKTIDRFSKERIYFYETGPHMEYFCIFFLESFYLTESEGKHNRIMEYYHKLFNIEHRKTKLELDIFTEVYKLLELNLKSKK